MQEMPRGERLDGKGGGNVETHFRRDGNHPLNGNNTLICEAARLLQKRRDPLARFHTVNARPDRGDMA